jgi:hypothetical protein
LWKVPVRDSMFTHCTRSGVGSAEYVSAEEGDTYRLDRIECEYLAGALFVGMGWLRAAPRQEEEQNVVCV